MKFKYYFSKDFQTSDNHDIESLKTHYYHARKEVAMEAVVQMAKDFKCKIKSIDEERGEIIFDNVNYNASATITATSYTEMAIDFIVLTFNFLPTAPGKKVIEKFYSVLDKTLQFKGISLYK